VLSQADSDVANVVLRKLTAAIKFVSNEIEPSLAAARETTNQIRALKNKILQPLEEAKTSLSGRLMAWREGERRKEAEERAKLEAEAVEKEKRARAAQKGHEVQGHEVSEPVIVEPTLPAPVLREDTTKVRKQWDIRIINKAKVPEEYKTINEVLLRKALHSAAKDEEGNPIFDVPGVEVYCKEIPVYA